MSIEQLKDAFKEKKLTYGFNETIKLVKRGKATVVFIAKGAEPKMYDDLTTATAISNTKVIELNATPQEVGAVCKKPFPVTILCY